MIVPEENDIALAKVVAWREKDIEWLTVGARFKLLNLQKMADRLDLMPDADIGRGVPPRNELERRLRALAAACRIELVFAPDTNEVKAPGR